MQVITKSVDEQMSMYYKNDLKFDTNYLDQTIWLSH